MAKSRFKDQVVWITGASSGIGAALARLFVKEGAIVALSARRVERLYALAKELGKNAHVFPLDVQKKNLVDECAEDIASKLQKIDTVVANAGYGVIGPAMDLTEEMWRRQFEINFFGVVWTLQACIRYLSETKGRIAIMSSVAGKIAFGHGAAYSASKFALMGLANALYLELYNTGISVTTIAPGIVESEIGFIDNLGNRQEKYKFGDRKLALRWPTEKAAMDMIDAIYQRKREQVITGHGKLAAFLGSYLPSLTYWGMAKAGIKTDQ